MAVRPGPREPAWGVLATLTLLALSAHVTLEWLFFVTKPSFLSAVSRRESLLLPGTVALPLLGGATVLVLACHLVVRLRPGGWAEQAGWFLARALPAAVLAATLLLLGDTFVYTLFGWGTVSLHGPARGLTLAVFGGLVAVLHRRVRRWEGVLAGRSSARRALYAAAGVVALASAGSAALTAGAAAAEGGAATGRGAAAGRRLPHVLLIGADGVNAERTSAYGYRRATTPFLASLARQSLLCENAFPNGSSTGGSTVSMLAGRLPTETGVVYPPDIARGETAYRHLPGLLRQLGYRSGQFTVRWYADGPDLNLQGAFDRANGRTITAPQLAALRAPLGQTGAYFMGLMGERLGERLLVARERPDPFRELRENRLPTHLDPQRIAQLRSFIDDGPQPFFAHVHLMVTHGPRFMPRRRWFSRGLAQRTEWAGAFYDDAILDFDRSLQEVVTLLRRRGLLERTILVVYSDHGQIYTTHDRVPLLFRFPRGAHAGRLRSNVQNLDVAPTVVDALGLRVPGWMEGVSLLRGEPPPCRRILSAIHDSEVLIKDGNWWYSVPRPPFYTLGALALLAGDRYFVLDLGGGRLATIRLRRSPGAPGSSCAMAPEAARRLLVGHLASRGYDVSTLRSTGRNGGARPGA